MICTACGAQNSQDSGFCSNCHAPLTSISESSTVSTLPEQISPIAASDEPESAPASADTPASSTELNEATDISEMLTVLATPEPESAPASENVPETPVVASEEAASVDIAEMPTQIVVDTSSVPETPQPELEAGEEARAALSEAPDIPENNETSEALELSEENETTEELETPAEAARDGEDEDETPEEVELAEPLAAAVETNESEVPGMPSSFAPDLNGEADADTDVLPEIAPDPVSPGAQHAVTPGGAARLLRPLPIWLYIPGALIVAAVLIFFTGADWAAGARTAALEALVAGALFLVIFATRVVASRLAKTKHYRRSQFISALVLLVLLAALGIGSLTQQTGVHAAQARFLEHQEQWQPAINEYQASGEHAPASENIARIYNEWGEQLTGLEQYENALARFGTVTSHYAKASTEVARAKKDTATAYYRLGEQRLAAHNYSGAISAFAQLTTHFSDSSEAHNAHADYARALMAAAQQQMATACSSAAGLYQQLARQFADTPEGQQAATALKQPQSVKGHFTSKIPNGDDVPEVFLVPTSNGLPISGIPRNRKGELMQVVKSDGTFDFQNVKQGQYQLGWGTRNKRTGTEVIEFISLSNLTQFPTATGTPSSGWQNVSGDVPFHMATVGPLCSFDFGKLDVTFPSTTGFPIIVAPVNFP